MSGSGVGNSFGGIFTCFAAVTGIMTPSTRVVTFAALTTRTVASITAAGSVLFCPQVNRELAGGQGVAKLEL